MGLYSKDQSGPRENTCICVTIRQITKDLLDCLTSHHTPPLYPKAHPVTCPGQFPVLGPRFERGVKQRTGDRLKVWDWRPCDSSSGSQRSLHMNCIWNRTEPHYYSFSSGLPKSVWSTTGGYKKNKKINKKKGKKLPFTATSASIHTIELSHIL